MVEEKIVQWDKGGVKVDELKEEVEVEWMVVKWEVVEVLMVEKMVWMVEAMVWMVEAGREDVLGIVTVSC